MGDYCSAVLTETLEAPDEGEVMVSDAPHRITYPIGACERTLAELEPGDGGERGLGLTCPHSLYQLLC